MALALAGTVDFDPINGSLQTADGDQIALSTPEGIELPPSGFDPGEETFIGCDRILKKINKNYKFDIRFHVEPDVKLMKTQDGKSILIELEDEGWKFTCDNYDINIDNGLYFGNKNSYIDNQNIFISGISNNQTEDIKWQIKKI